MQTYCFKLVLLLSLIDAITASSFFGFGSRSNIIGKPSHTSKTKEKKQNLNNNQLKKASLYLEDGSVFQGFSFGADDVNVTGELVFSTGMVGYPESLTDPSYAGQILALTSPMIGNYGVPNTKQENDTDLSTKLESDRIHVSALLVQDYSDKYSHWEANQSLSQWLKDEGIPALFGIDTRQLTRKIRSKGTMKANIRFDNGNSKNTQEAFKQVFLSNDLSVSPTKPINHLVAKVSNPEVRVFGKGNKVRILAVDCGIKYNIIRMLMQRDVEVTVVPWDFKFSQVLDQYDGLFLSNGPGDPLDCDSLIEELKKVIALEGKHVKPIFGICLGSQLLGLAAGAKTEKMKFGHRSQNQPVRNVMSGGCFITPQNHGYCIDGESLPTEWKVLFENVNDGSNEGIMHASKPFFSAQFHPEANGGPTDSAQLFDVFIDLCKQNDEVVTAAVSSTSNPTKPFFKPLHFTPRVKNRQPLPKVSKVLILGSGGLSIGQAGEFDYSGSQAIKALKEEGVEVLLINPNIASVQTNVIKKYKDDEKDQSIKHDDIDDDEEDDASLPRKEGIGGGDSVGAADNDDSSSADKVFFVPVTVEYVEDIIKREKPDAILISMGGQTALNCGVKLHQLGILEANNVRVLGTPVEAVRNTEDRELFAEKMVEINEQIARSFACDSLEKALKAAQVIGYPVMIRSAFALGGLGSCICTSQSMLIEMATKALAMSSQILVEQSMLGWKEVEYEVVRDVADNCVTVCNMENFDPLGVHTGESIVIAPSQTLSNEEYHMLRETSIRVVRHLGIIGECNIQFALHPNSTEYRIIEVNARLSRSSALASKATGYPLAAVAAKLALGKTMDEIDNSLTKVTKSCFEPSLDYVVTKIPIWEFAKFNGVSNKIGTSMKSVGEVMGIGRTFQESFQKALRMSSPSVEGFQPSSLVTADVENGKKEKENVMSCLIEELKNPTDKRVFAIAHALYERVLSVDEIHRISNIDKWFLERLNSIAEEARSLGGSIRGRSLDTMQAEEMLHAKQLGFSDRQLAQLLLGDVKKELVVRAKRKDLCVKPFVKQIDTLSAEYEARTNYLYCTYHGSESDIESESSGKESSAVASGGIAILGSGAYRIGSSVEFDSCGVSALRTLQEANQRCVMINYNPETVSTDYDECNQLYFEELSLERVLDILEQEHINTTLMSMGGQIPQNLVVPLYQQNISLMGTSASSIDCAEDRNKFSSLLDRIHVKQPEWNQFSDEASALSFADKVGYPVLVRPSYVLSGAAMNVATSPQKLKHFLKLASVVSKDSPVVVSKFIEGAREIEMDAVARSGKVVLGAVTEHVEDAGVHSGDACIFIPPQDLAPESKLRIHEITREIARELNISGPFNIQFLVKEGEVKVIECNLRASRSFPFVSKAMGVDFIEVATQIMLANHNLNHQQQQKQPQEQKEKDIIDSSSDRESLLKKKLSKLPQLEDRWLKPYVGCKVPTFSFTRLPGADPVLGVEMASTGEVACFGKNKHEAFLKAFLASGFQIPEKNILLCFDNVDSDNENEVGKMELIQISKSLVEMGFHLFATNTTYHFLTDRNRDIPCTLVHDSSFLQNDGSESKFSKKSLLDQQEQEGLDVVTLLKQKHFHLVINIQLPRSNKQTSMSHSQQLLETDNAAKFEEDVIKGRQHLKSYHIRRMTTDFGVPLLTHLQLTRLFVDALGMKQKGEILNAEKGMLYRANEPGQS